MLAEQLFGRRGDREFRWRGQSVSRIEGLSDAVFALAFTLIIVTLEVPKTFAALLDVFRAVPAFTVCFASLALCWWHHYRFHRRYGLEDGWTTLFNLAFLFVILLYVYPLRFLFDLLFAMVRVGPAAASENVIAREQIPTLMIVYGIGFCAVFALLAALNARAWQLRLELELDSVERVLTKSALHGHLASVAIGVVSIAVVSFDRDLAGWAGMLYGLMGPVHGIHGVLTGRAVARYRGKLPGAPFAS